MRFNLRLIVSAIFILFFALAVAGGLLWANLNFIQHTSGGADFFVLWQGTRSFMMEGKQPYADLTPQIKPLVYGPGPHPGAFFQRVNLPFYLLPVFFLLGAIKDPNLARAVWMLLLELGLTELVLFGLQLVHWKPGWGYLALLVLFGLFWSPAAVALLSGNLIIFQAILLFGAMRAMAAGFDELAGALIAFAWFNFEATGLLIFLLLFWAFSMRRLRIWAGAIMVTVILIALSVLLNPTWIFPFLGAVVENWRMNTNISTFSLFEAWLPGIGVRLAQGLALAAALMLIMEWRAVRDKEMRWLVWTASLTVAATPLMGLPFDFVSLVLFLPGLCLVLSVMEQRWGAFGRWSAIALIVLLFMGLWWALFWQLGSAYLLLFPFLLIFLLYWIRWWAIRPPRLWADMISDVGPKYDAP